jgi:small subunit ribosomal protein S1
MTEDEKKEEMSFAQLFEANPQTPGRGVTAGATVSGEVVKIGKETIFVDLGGKSEGMVDIAEFLDENKNLTVKKGDKLQLRVASTRDGIHLSKGIKVHGADAIDVLRDAQRSLIPVEGRVSGVNKGGFDVDISGIRAFCPISQIDLQYCEKPEKHIGAKYQFRIKEIKEGGRNVLVSRRVLLQEEQEKKLKETLAKIQPGVDLEGKVTRVVDFGAFVDIGGIDGMVHVSEISHARINHPSEVLKTGESVRVRVIKIEPDKSGRKKIALSMKALEPDAWEKGIECREGDILRGKISRLTDFGAFVEIGQGLEGLVHVSEISYERVTHPKKILNEGDIVDVLVLKIDQEKRRLSLSIKEATVKKQMAEYEKETGKARLEVGQILKGIVEDGKPYGLFVRLPQFGIDVRGLLPMEELGDSGKGDLKKKFPRGTEIQVEIVAIDENGRIRLSQKVMADREDQQDYEKFLKKGDRTGLGTLGDIFKDVKIDEKKEE